MRNCLFCHVRSKWAREYRQKARDVHFSQINVHNRGGCGCSGCVQLLLPHLPIYSNSTCNINVNHCQKTSHKLPNTRRYTYSDSHYYNIMLPTLTHEYIIIMRDTLHTHVRLCICRRGEFIAGVYKERLYASCHPEYARFHYTHVAAASHAI